MVKYGDILLVDFNPVKGREVSKIRPAVVVSNNIINEEGPYVVVVPISSNIRRMLPFQLFIGFTKQNGLNVDSKAMPESIKSVDAMRIVRKIGHLEYKYIEDLEDKILYILNQTLVP